LAIPIELGTRAVACMCEHMQLAQCQRDGAAMHLSWASANATRRCWLPHY
jgi:hypothetical protein